MKLGSQRNQRRRDRGKIFQVRPKPIRPSGRGLMSPMSCGRSGGYAGAYADGRRSRWESFPRWWESCKANWPRAINTMGKGEQERHPRSHSNSVKWARIQPRVSSMASDKLHAYIVPSAKEQPARGKCEKKWGRRIRVEPLKPDTAGNKVARGIFRVR